ncbi:hypothetical protein B0H14DRAFT_2797825 [Mycena olivaceomarginata]|nr:hypothetical protein B0H14DRAFT_2797825 [Mycena olivaceomarginata]
MYSEREWHSAYRNPARVASHCLLNSAAIRQALCLLHWLPPSSLGVETLVWHCYTSPSEASSILTAPSCLFINDFTTFPAVASKSVPHCSRISRYSQRGDIGRRRLKPRTTIFSHLRTFKAKYRVSPPCALPAGRSHACRVARSSPRSSAPRRATCSPRSPITHCIPRT